MSSFDVLLIAHLFGDFLFQTNWMAVNKTERMLSLVIHSLVYTLTILLFSFVLSIRLSLWAVPLIFITHCILDRRWFPVWWVRNVMRVHGSEAEWFVIIVDQIFHLFVLGVSLYI